MWPVSGSLRLVDLILRLPNRRLMARPRKTHAQPPPPARIHLGGPAQGEEALPRESAEISNGPVGVAQDAAVAPLPAAVEKTPGAVLGHAAAGVDDWRVVKRSRERHAVDATFPLAVPKARPHALRRLPCLMFCPTNNARKTYTK